MSRPVNQLADSSRQDAHRLEADSSLFKQHDQPAATCLLQVRGELVKQVVNDVGSEDAHAQLLRQRGRIARHCKAVAMGAA